MNYVILAMKCGFSHGSVVKNPLADAGNLSSVPGSGRSPGEGNGATLVLLPGKSHGWRSLEVYSPSRGNESDMT